MPYKREESLQPSILTTRKELDRKRKEEIKAINLKYSELKKKLEDHCIHNFTTWNLRANPEYRFNFNGDPIYTCVCQLCGKVKTKVGK